MPQPIRVGNNLRIRTSSGYVHVSLSQLTGDTVGALRAYLEKIFPADVVRLSGQRVTYFKQNEPLNSILKRAKMGTNSSVLFVAEDCGRNGWDVGALDSYSLVAITEKETPLLDDVPLRWYINGVASYRFDVLRPQDLRQDEFEMFVMVHSNSRLQLLVSPHWTIRRIKSEISQCTGLPTYTQRLFTKTSAGDLLPDYKTVMDCGFVAKTCIELTLAAASPKFKSDREVGNVLAVTEVTRPCDIRIRVPRNNRIVAVKCDKTDAVEAVKARLATRLDPRNCGHMIARSPSCGSPSTPELEDDEEEDPDTYLERCLRTLSLESLPSTAQEDEEALEQLGLNAQELMAALRASRAQVRALQAELRLCKEQQARKSSRKQEAASGNMIKTH